MTDFALDTLGEMVIETGDIKLVDGIDAIASGVASRLEFWLGEWFLDKRLGVPYMTQILGQKPRLVAVRGIFRKVILSELGVIDVEDLLVEYDGPIRKLSLSFTGVCELGKFVYDRELII